MNRAVSRGGARFLQALALGFACSAQAAPGGDGLGWLQKAAESARATNYTGTFVHTNGDRTQTVRVTHVNAGGEEHERIEPLDGPRHEIVRRNDEMFCYFPDDKTVRLDRRITAPFFPSILRASPEAVAESYEVKLGNTERILGYDCQWILLEPRDSLRFAQRLCVETTTGLVLRAKALNGLRHVMEQYTFTDLRFGPSVARADVKSIFEARNRQWTVDKRPRDEARHADTGWIVADPPSGFRKVTELTRTLPGRGRPVSQLVYSDGLATLSVFVEPNVEPARTTEGFTEDGTTAFYVRPMGEHLVTVLGEVPLAAAQQVGRSVARRR